MTTTENTRTNDELQMILSRFSHEIRNPLALLSSELQLLSDQIPEVTAYKDWDIILDHISYIEDLLKDFSSYGNARMLDPVPTNLSNYLSELIDTVRPTMNYLKIQLDIQISGELPNLLLDRTKFRQAFLNIIRNAQEAVPVPHGQIIIRCEALPDKEILLSISDNGPGLTKEQLTNIFQPFVTYKSNGTGLGLPIAREIIEAHGGVLSMCSQPDEGCTVQFRLRG